MQRYFFHTHIGDDVVVDPDGRELASADAAWDAARILARQLLQGADSDPALLTAVLFVEDEAREIILEFPLSEALIEQPVPEPERGGGTLH
ncbi:MULTISPECIES: hypothetical protein [unclassified Methylobacterium]|uniref:DUF6894 family protein n=1 Tax=unclassified Methylobacterium TaxID=2615210 RepID=UPI0006F1D2D4|nr:MULTISPECIES: hypothetical protein [unclassified Methylobacterium]KQP82604.1 hypothetical protein ASF57_10490 [Methylobacterium sp. Leaf117]KQP93018.1 hypothetical protein ASF60_15760 [Methylobacterium sp. Leaf113]MCK2053097.1 hypothetical protein [Methylobacterium sp. 37f]